MLAPPPAAPASVPAREERRVVTVLFSDLAGFTSRSESLDPEDARALLVPYYAILENEITGHGGVVERHIGDGIMALFGAPVAHEDDPERAIRAALKILERIPALGTDLHARIGINTGELLYRSEGAGREDAITGDAANTAARLQGLAPVDGVVVGESTYRATGKVFEYVEHPQATVKGKAEPIRVFQPTAPRARFGVDLTRTHDTPYVGRRAELAAMTGAFDAVVAEQTARFVTVVAPAGMGKSRFIAQLGDHVEASPGLVTWRQGRCLPYGDGITFWALGEIVKAHAGILENDDPATASAKILDTLPESSEREWLHQRLLPLVGVAAGPSAERGELFTAWRTFIAGIADPDPAVILFEDLHWADEAILAFIEDLVANARDVPLLIVGTARPELFERHPGFAGGLASATRINLAPLDDADAVELVAALLGSVVPEDLRAPILERAAGNPLYVEEFVRLLGDRDLLVEVDGVVALRAGATLPLPGTIGALLAARLDMLEPDRRALLGNASVIGKVFWSGGVAALAERERAAVDTALAELADRQLLRPAAVSSMAGEHEYAFWHVLARDVAYGQLPRATRAALHVAAAKWLESRAGQRVDDVAELLAYHWTTALELTRAAGQTGQAAELEAAALRYLTLAGDKAMNLDVAAAVASYERALALAPPGHKARAQVLRRLGPAVGAQARAHDAVTYLEEAVAGFLAAGDREHADAAALELAWAYSRRGDESRAQVIGDEVATRLEPNGPSETLVRALNLASRGSNYRDPRDTEREERAIAMADELGLARLHNELIANRALRRVNTGDPRGMVDLRASLALAVEMGDQRHVARLYYWLGSCMGAYEDPQAALDFFDEGLAFTRRRGFLSIEFFIRQDRWIPLFRLGRWSEILEGVEAQIKDAVPLGLSLSRTMTGKIAVLSLTGHEGEAASLALAEAEDVARAYGYGTQRIRALRSEGDDAGALALVVEAVRQMREDDYTLHGTERLDFVREAIGLGRIDLAKDIAAQRTTEFAIDHPAEQRSIVAVLAEAEGRTSDAVPLFEDAAHAWGGLGDPYETAMASLGAGRCLVALGQSSEARAYLERAREAFERLGAVRALAETRSLLEACAI